MKNFLCSTLDRITNRLRPRLRFAASPDFALKPIRFGVVGLGTIGQMHANALVAHNHSRLTAIATRDRSKQEKGSNLGVAWFANAIEMYESGLVDAVVIATPHQTHTELALQAIERGLHVLCEKPLAVSALDAHKISAAAVNSGVLLAVVHQHHASPGLQKIQQTLVSGCLGEIARADLVETFPRDPDYYSGTPERGTWHGEGGGALVNQAIHAIDRYIWLFGMPASLSACTKTRFHDIEVEDTVSISAQHQGSMIGTIFVSTAPSPSLFSLQVLCRAGAISFENGILKIQSDSAPANYFVETAIPTAELFAKVHDNFAIAIAGHQRPWVSAERATQAVELMNAAYVASGSKQAETLPVSNERFIQFSQFMTEQTKHAF